MKIKVLNLPNGDKRIVFGKFLEQFDLDYTQDLDKIKRDIQFALSAIERNPRFFADLFDVKNHNVRVFQDNHHIDIIDEDKKISLGWLTVEDQWRGFFSIAETLSDEDEKALDDIFPSTKQ